jgi:hypothetical protein
MEIHVDELHTTADTMSLNALLTPQLLARIVAAVRADLAADQARHRDRAADVDFRSPVEQQRARKR